MYFDDAGDVLALSPFSTSSGGKGSSHLVASQDDVQTITG